MFKVIVYACMNNYVFVFVGAMYMHVYIVNSSVKSEIPTQKRFCVGFGILSIGTTNGGRTYARLGQEICAHLATLLASGLWTSLEGSWNRSPRLQVAEAPWLLLAEPCGWWKTS